MKPGVPLLAPILRSDTQGRLLSDLYLFPERGLTPTQLAASAGTSLPTVLREVDRLLESGYVLERRSGRNRYIQVNIAHPLFRPLSEIIEYAYGPIAVLPRLLAPISGIREAYVYGSWAARIAGEPGHDPHDIDVLVVGDPDRFEIHQAAQKASSLLMRETNIRIVSPEAWQSGDDIFLSTVQSRPLEPLRLTESIES